VNDDFDGVHIGPERVLVPGPPKRNLSGRAIGLVLFVFLASGTAYIWFNYGDQVRAAVLPESPRVTPIVAPGADALGRADFEAYQQKSMELLRSAVAGLDAQKDEFRRISDRLSALESKVDAMRSSPLVTATVPVAPAAQIATVAPSPTVMPRAPAPAQPKRPAAPKLPGRVSVGGAPLPGPAN
jgi:hypothetical protein